MAASDATGVSNHESQIKHRGPKTIDSEEPRDSDIIEDSADEKKELPPSKFSNLTKKLTTFEAFIGPIAFTLLAAYVRLYLIDISPKVIWDEAHFGKFGSYYIKHEFYHDVHPPLGKMLIGLSEWIAGFDGDFEFKSGNKYPETCDFKTMRIFNALFSAAVIPVAYFTSKTLELKLITTYLITLMITLESSYIALGKFILLDSILLFFTATTFFTFIKVHSLKKKGEEFTTKWYAWMILTGLSIGCVCSVKWVGLFITVVVGLYTVQDLIEKFFEKDFNWRKYSKHWAVRIACLIIIPFLVYLLSFKVHFALLYKSGTGDASTSSLFQVNLENNKINLSPRSVLYGSEVTIRSHGLSPNLLHSHHQIYPEGSNQQQITAYGHSDGNNNWVFKPSRASGLKLTDANFTFGSITDGDVIRLSHKYTGVNLHSHEVAAHVTKHHREVSGYGSEVVGDSKDDWIFEIVQQLPSRNSSYPKEDQKTLHPLSTSFRLRHSDLGCYLATTGMAYPAWGFKQSEVVCKEAWSKNDKSTWWNVEDHINSKLEIDPTYIPPKSNFWSDFILINFAMASSNNALVPDEDKFDNLASQWWEWPTLHVGLRMCGWGFMDYRYFLIGNVFNTWGSSLALIAFVILSAYYIIRYQRQRLDWGYEELSDFLIKGFYPFAGWVFHFLPFVIMGRVTYVHHYVPALFFAIFVLGYYLELVVEGRKPIIKYGSYLIAFGLLLFSYFYYAPFHYGMHGNHNDFKQLELLKTWRVTEK